MNTEVVLDFGSQHKRKERWPKSEYSLGSQESEQALEHVDRAPVEPV